MGEEEEEDFQTVSGERSVFSTHSELVSEPIKLSCLLLLQSLCVCVCVCVCEGRGSK